MNEHERMALKISAIRQACAAINHMTAALHEQYIAISFVQKHTPEVPMNVGAEKVIDSAIDWLSFAMDEIGDYLNERDAVGEDDEAATRNAFVAVSRALKLQLPAEAIATPQA